MPARNGRLRTIAYGPGEYGKPLAAHEGRERRGQAANIIGQKIGSPEPDGNPRLDQALEFALAFLAHYQAPDKLRRVLGNPADDAWIERHHRQRTTVTVQDMDQ